MNKELLFSVTANDCDWNYVAASSKGGQKANKTASKVFCKHRASGAIGTSNDTRSQTQNKQIAFKRMSETKEFKNWHKLECAKTSGQLQEIEEKLDHEMKYNTKVEVKENGRWVKENSK